MRKAYLIFFFALVSSISVAQEYKYHPIFIYNFSKYIEWPAEKSGQDFVISVVGNDMAYRQMLDIVEKKKTIKDRPVVVKKYSKIDEVGNSDMLFVTKYEKLNADKVIAKQASGTLIITEHKNMAETASHINFVISDSKIGFELNSALAEASGLKVSNSLVSLAKKSY